MYCVCTWLFDLVELLVSAFELFLFCCLVLLLAFAVARVWYFWVYVLLF